jgi:signal transduction histidine kinase
MRTDRGWRRFYATGWLVSAAVAMVAGRMWQLHVRDLEERTQAAERGRDEAARHQAAQERLRIARELHDSLTHSISVVQVQAGVAAHLARRRGEEVPPPLQAIQEAGQDAARELRATLGALRADDDAGPSGLDRIPGLLARMRAGGLTVTMTETGPAYLLPPEVDQAAYRIVQEALTNVTRHAGQATAAVQLCYGPGELVVQVDDDGAGPSRSSGVPGLGLIGMRERVTSLGGRLAAGPRPGGGFTVRAELPLQARP